MQQYKHMKNKTLWILALIICLGLTACSKDEQPKIEIPGEFASVTFAEEEKNQTITFEANQSWSASVTDTKTGSASWLTVSPQSGNAGRVTLTLSAADNYSREERNTYLHITVDGLSKVIPVKQHAGIPVLTDDEAPAVIPSKGFFVANEDWFGHDNGTVNYFQKNGTDYTISYRAYRAANPNENDWLGTTTQFAAIWGDYVYFCSKQGNRLVVADARSLKKKAVFPAIGGDGRSFTGIDDTKGYIGHANGIAIFDIAGMKPDGQIEGVSSQIGSMCLSNGRVFAVSQRNGLYIINAETNVVEQNIAGSYNTLARSKDGDVWIASSKKLIRMNPVTLETEEMDYPGGASVGSSWGAWNAGSLCAGTQHNTLYWASGGKVIKYDIDTKTANTAYTLGKSESGTQLAFYGAGLRVDPLTDELILTVKHSGWGASGAYNWIYKLNADGQEITHFKVKGDNGSGASWAGNAEDWDGKYFWFPAMPFFEDANRPQILINQILVKTGETKEIDLDEKIVDYDNTKASMQKSIVLENENLLTAVLEGGKLTITAGNKPGKTLCTVSVISNGVRADKTVRIDIER